MMNLDKVKKIPIILCGIIVLFSNIEECSAKTLKFIGRLVDGGGHIIKDPTTPFEEWVTFKNGESTYRYRYKKEINTNTSISMNAYNLKGESVIPKEIKIDSKNAFKAGTWIGINVTEKHQASWQVYDFEYQKLMTEFTCSYTKKQCTCTSKTNPTGEGKCPNKYKLDKTKNKCIFSYGCPCDDEVDIVETHREEYGKSYSCPSKYNYKVEKTEKTIYPAAVPPNKTEKENEVALKTYNEAVESISYSAAVVKYIGNNKYPTDEKKIVTNTIDIGKYDGDGLPPYKKGQRSGELEKDYEILEKKVCIDLKTSEVTYGNDCNPSDSVKQIQNGTIYDDYLKENVNYWHYFIPLNIKSNQLFYLDVIKNSSATKIFPVKQCKTFMEENEDYRNYIVPVNKKNEITSFAGETYGSDIITIEAGNGCYISTRIVFPIKQEFYKEEKDAKNNVKLKGFNFYYRPIDINNPFPNGIGSNSIWFDWNKSTSKNPDITKSYSEGTYIAANINGSKIRNDNKGNSYANWNNMNLDGKSNYIGNGVGSIIQRINSGSIYKLGCGPNKNNPIYNGWCDKK